MLHSRVASADRTPPSPTCGCCSFCCYYWLSGSCFMSKHVPLLVCTSYICTRVPILFLTCVARPSKQKTDTWYVVLLLCDSCVAKTPDKTLEPRLPPFFFLITFCFSALAPKVLFEPELAGQMRAPWCTPVSVPKRQHFPCPPFRTAVPFWGQTTQIPGQLSLNRDCGPKRV